MWALWDPAHFRGIGTYADWKRELLHESDRLRRVRAGHMIPISVDSEFACEFELRVAAGGAPATLREREALYRAAASRPFLLECSGDLFLGGIDDVAKSPGPEVARIRVRPGRYAVAVYLIDWKREPGSSNEDGTARAGSLPDFVLLANPASTDFIGEATLDTFRQQEPPPRDPELARALEAFVSRRRDAFGPILKALMRSTVLLGAQRSPEERSALSVPLPEGVDVPLLAVQSKGGRRLLALFTDIHALEARRPGCGWVAMAGSDALIHALRAKFDGVVLNPAGPCVEIARDVLARAV